MSYKQQNESSVLSRRFAVFNHLPDPNQIRGSGMTEDILPAYDKGIDNQIYNNDQTT